MSAKDTEILFLVTTNAHYYYLKIKGDMLPKFLRESKNLTDSNIKIFGTVVEQGKGIPSKQVKNRMVVEYDCCLEGVDLGGVDKLERHVSGA